MDREKSIIKAFRLVDRYLQRISEVLANISKDKEEAQRRNGLQNKDKFKL